MWIENKYPYKDYRVYGIYETHEGRQFVIVISPQGKRTTVSYAKYLIEIKYGRKLAPDETVHHIDGNPKNNDYSNLQVITRSEHAKRDVHRLKPKTFRCPMCGKTFSLSGKKLHDAILNRKYGRAGPFCSKKCAGRYSRLVQLKRILPLPVKRIKAEYYKLSEHPPSK